MGHRDSSGERKSRKRRRSSSSSSGDLEVRLLIKSAISGSIIGRGGEVIKRFRQDYSASINIPDSSTAERIVVLAGEREDVIRIVKECLKKISESEGTVDSDCRILVHQSHAGAVIGKGGAEVRKLRENSEVQITVFGKCCPSSTERVIKMVGSLDNVIDCLRQVLEICGRTVIRSVNRQYNTFNSDPIHFDEYGGFPPDKNFRNDDNRFGRGGPRGDRRGGGRDFRDSRDRRDVRSIDPWDRSRIGRNDFSRRESQFGSGGMMGGGGGDFTSPLRATGGQMMGGGGGGMSGGGGGNAHGGGGGMGGPMQCIQVTVPDELAGSIIGKRGRTIADVRADSGANISVDEPRHGQMDRLISISGSTSQIQRAQYLLQQW